MYSSRNAARVARLRRSILSLSFACALSSVANAQAPDSRPIEVITRDLSSDTTDVRREAALELISASPDFRKQALPSIIARLEVEKDGQVRLAFFETISRLGREGSPAEAALVDSIRKIKIEHDEERQHQYMRATLALAAIGESAVDELVSLLGDDNPEIAGYGAEAIGNIGQPAHPAVDKLVALVASENAFVGDSAATALGKIGSVSIGPLTEKWKSSSPVIRSRILKAFRAMPEPNPAVTELAVNALSGQEPLEVAAAVELLPKCGLPESQLNAELVKALSNQSPLVRLAAVNVLADEPSTIATLLPDLKQNLNSSDAEVAKHSAVLIARLKLEAIDTLIGSLEHEPSHVGVVGEAMGRIGAKATPNLLSQLSNSNSRVRSGAANALGQIVPPSPETVGKLTDLLNDSNREVRLEALGAIAQLGRRAESAAPAIRLLLKDPDAQFRRRTADVIFAISGRSEKLLEELLPLLDDSDPINQQHGIALLKSLGPVSRRAIPKVREKLASPDKALVLTGCDFLASHGLNAGEATKELSLLLTSADKDIRLAALTTFGQLRAASANSFDAISQCAQDPESKIRIAALNALVSTGAEFDRVAPFLDEALASTDTALQTESIRLIGRIGRPASRMIPKLIPLADTEERRRSVERALGSFMRSGPDTEAIPILVELTKNANVPVRKLAVEFIGLAGERAKEQIPVLEALKSDPEESVRKSVDAAIEKIVSPPKKKSDEE